jgi:putative transposase
MPWKKNSEPEQRWGLIQLVLRAQLGLAELCRGSGISRKTAYKWLARFKEQGRQGLRNQTRCAHDLHNRPTERWLQRLRRRRRRNPTWGAPKIHWALRRRFGRRGLPAAGAIGRWLKSWGLTRRRRARALKGPSLLRPTLTQARQSHEVWTVDFKGWFRTGDGTKVAPLTVRDLATRYILLFCLLPRQRVGAARLAFERGFGVYGLPLVIRAVLYREKKQR